MSLPECTVNTSNIQNLPDAPLLSSDELKQEFDKAGKLIKDYINDILNPAIENLVRTEVKRLESSISSNKTTLDNRITTEKSSLQKEISNKILEDNKKKYPVGKILMSTKNVNPNSYLGFGTWVLWGAGRVPVGVNTSDSNFNTVEKTGGASTHSHSQGSTGSGGSGNTGAHKLTIAEMPKHRHDIKNGSVAKAPIVDMASGGNHWGLHWETKNGYYCDIGSMAETGGDGAHSHPLPGHTHTNPNTNASSTLQPYITCYMWKRTA